MTIEYVTLTCNAQPELTNAQLDTFLKGTKHVVLGDTDALDIKLKMMSITRKWLKYFLTMKHDDDFIFTMDDDTWVNTRNVERVCEHLPSTPTVCYYSTCPVRSFDHNSRKVWGADAQLSEEALMMVNGVCYNPDMLMNKAALDMLLNVFETDELYKKIKDIFFNDTKLPFDTVSLFPYTGAQIHVFRRAFALMKKQGCDFRGVSCVKIGTKQDFTAPVIGNNADPVNVSKKWLVDTRLPVPYSRKIKHLKRMKSISDFNMCFPMLEGGDIDAEKAVELSNVTEFQHKMCHVLPDRASCMTFHKLKRPSMFHQMQEATQRGV